MADNNDLKISQLPQAQSLAGSELLLFGGAANGSVSAETLKAYAQDGTQGELSDSDDILISDDDKLALTERAKRAVFNDMWDSAWKANGAVYGKYDPENAPDAEHPYLGNGIWMTYEEAMTVLNYGKTDKWANGMFAYTDIRTNIPSLNFGNGNKLETNNLCSACHKLEVFVFLSNPGVPWNGDKLFYTFSDCRKLKAIRGSWRLNTIIESGGGSFSNCFELEEIDGLVLGPQINELRIQCSPKISLGSLQGIISRSLSTGCVITLHADTFAKACGDTTNEAAAALTPEELAQWTALPTAAAAKNITFAEA